MKLWGVAFRSEGHYTPALQSPWMERSLRHNTIESPKPNRDTSYSPIISPDTSTEQPGMMFHNTLPLTTSPNTQLPQGKRRERGAPDIQLHREAN